MTELELRVAALELLQIERGAWEDPEILADMERSIRASLGGGCTDEDVVRRRALELIHDGRKRFRPDFPWVRVQAGR